MYEKNGKPSIIAIELIAVYILLVSADFFIFHLHLLQWHPSPFLLITFLFALRYGLRAGLSAFAVQFFYVVGSTYFQGLDVFLIFYDWQEAKWLALSLAGALASGLARANFTERYDDLHIENEELKEKNAQLEKTVKRLNDSRKALREKVLESENSIVTVYETMKALNHDDPEIVMNEAATILADTFKARRFAIYHLDGSGQSLRMKVRMDQSEQLQQTIFITENSFFYQRLLKEKNIVMRQEGDEKTAPILAGPIMNNGEIDSILVIHELDFYRLTEHGLHLLKWLLRWISDKLEDSRAVYRRKMKNRLYPGTRIYKREAFSERAAIERKRQEDLGQPCAVFRLPLRSDGPRRSLMEVDLLLHAQLRELDIVGLDESENELLFLLPGTEERYIPILKQRIDQAMSERVVHHGG